MGDVLLCADLGTTRLKAAAFKEGGGAMAAAGRPMPPFLTWSGFLAFDPEACLFSLYEALREVVAALPEETAVRGLILTHQRATVVPVDEACRAVAPALSWQDASGGPLLTEFTRSLGEGRFSRLTGLPPSAFLTLPKILRLRRDSPAVFCRAHKFLSLGDFAIKRLGSERFVTDPSNASVTGLFDIEKLAWSGELLDAAGLPASLLPDLAGTSSACGTLSREASAALGIAPEAVLLVGGGDQQFSALGTGASKSGDGALCLGSAAILSVLVDRPRTDLADRFFCTAHVAPGRWVVEGIHGTFTGSLEWAGPALGMASAAERLEALEASPAGARGVVFFPFLNGVGTPDHDASCAGTFTGLRRTHTAQDMMRAVYEGIVFEARRMIEEAASAVPLERLLVSGGFTREFPEKLLADLLGKEILISADSETTLTGAAVAGWAGLCGREDPGRAAPAAGYRIAKALEKGTFDLLFAQYKERVAKVRECYARGAHAG